MKSEQEIQKLYDKANIVLNYIGESEGYSVNPFTFEKQIKLIAEFINNPYFKKIFMFYLSSHTNFSCDLAKMVNCIWDDIRECDKEYIRAILKGDF